jgi:WS/DGAT/MGAT family acyltransferase
METIGVVDQLFYKADQYEVVSLVMGGASVLEPVQSDAPLQADVIADHIGARLEQVPLLRKKFVQDPLRIGSVRKVEDPDFDIREHIAVRSLPAPGGQREFTDAMAELSARPLTVSHLWRYTVIDGMEGGKLAIVCQMHHALFDGLGAMDALSAMYDPAPVTPEIPRGRPEPPADEPSPYALLVDAIAESTRRLLVKTPRFLRNNSLPLLGSLASGFRSLVTGDSDAISLPTLNKTSLNIGSSSGTRSVAYKTLSLPEIKTLARHFHCTVNDVALLLYSYALQHYFSETGEDIDFDLVCGMPISIRQEGASVGNQVVAARIKLHNTIDDPVKRLQAIQQETLEGKKSSRPEELPFDASELEEVIPPLMLDALAYLFARLNLWALLGSHIPVLNALLSNVPGPPGQMYIANALLTEIIPLIPAVGLIAVSSGITSVSGSLTFGFHCDGEAVTEPELMARGVELGLDALRKASGTARMSRGRKKGGAAAAREKSRVKSPEKSRSKNSPAKRKKAPAKAATATK